MAPKQPSILVREPSNAEDSVAPSSERAREARLRLVMEQRVQGVPDVEVAAALGFTTRQALVRFAGPRKAALAALPPEPDEPPVTSPAPEVVRMTTPLPPAADRYHPDSTPARRRRFIAADEERLGNRVYEWSGDLSVIWSGERLRAATHRKLAEVAAKKSREYNAPFAVVRFEDGSARVVPASDIIDVPARPIGLFHRDTP